MDESVQTQFCYWKRNSKQLTNVQHVYENPHTLIKEAQGPAFVDFCVHYKYSGIENFIFYWYQTQFSF